MEKRHEVNCLTKEEFERWSRSPPLARQASQLMMVSGASIAQSPLGSSSSANDAIKSQQPLDQCQLPLDDNLGAGRPAGETARADKALALMVQPSVDYG